MKVTAFFDNSLTQLLAIHVQNNESGRQFCDTFTNSKGRQDVGTTQLYGPHSSVSGEYNSRSFEISERGFDVSR